MKFLMKITEHPVISTLLATFILWLIGQFFIPEVLNNIFTTVKDFFFQSVSLPLYLVILVSSILVAGLLFIVTFLVAKKSGPAWSGYTSDIFLNVKWSWQYFSDGQINSATLSAYCTKDETPLIAERVPNNYKNRLVCETCGLASDEFGEGAEELLAKVKRMIVREVRTKYPDNK